MGSETTKIDDVDDVELFKEFYPLPWSGGHGTIVAADGTVVCKFIAVDTAPDRKPMNAVERFIVERCNREGMGK